MGHARRGGVLGPGCCAGGRPRPDPTPSWVSPEQSKATPGADEGIAVAHADLAHRGGHGPSGTGRRRGTARAGGSSGLWERPAPQLHRHRGSGGRPVPTPRQAEPRPPRPADAGSPPAAGGPPRRSCAAAPRPPSRRVRPSRPPARRCRAPGLVDRDLLLGHHLGQLLLVTLLGLEIPPARGRGVVAVWRSGSRVRSTSGSPWPAPCSRRDPRPAPTGAASSSRAATLAAWSAKTYDLRANTDMRERRVGQLTFLLGEAGLGARNLLVGLGQVSRRPGL